MPVLCFGEILVDCLAERPQQSLASEQTWMTYAGGAPANVASALAKLGQSVCFMGCVGNDHSGRALIATLTEAGVNCDYATLHRTLPTRQVYVLRDPEGDRQFLGFGERDPASFADAQFKPEWVAAEGFEKADFLVMGTLGLAYPDTGQAMARALTLADAQFAKVVVDVNWRPSFWPQPELAGPIILEFLRQADFLKLSADEAHWLFQTDAPQAIAQRLDQLEGVMVTHGAAGCTYCFGDRSGHVPAFEVEVEDTTGAGDAFLAGFLAQISNLGLGAIATPEAARRTITYASAVGGLTTLRTGAMAAQPTHPEVEAFLYLNGDRQLSNLESYGH